jgi:hypothetical protein
MLKTLMYLTDRHHKYSMESTQKLPFPHPPNVLLKFFGSKAFVFVGFGKHFTGTTIAIDLKQVMFRARQLPTVETNNKRGGAILKESLTYYG